MKTIPVRPMAAVKLWTLALLTLIWLLLSGCHWVGEKGNGNVVTQNRTVEPFTTIEADGAFTMTWSPGSPSFSVTTDENLMEYIRTRVEDGRLRVDWVKPLKGTRGIKVNVTSEKLTGAQLNGALKFEGKGLGGPELFLEANGATRMNLEGNVDSLTASMNGASKLEASALQTRVSELAINGAGRADVNATEALRVAVSGAGKVTYSGDPQVQQEINGAGSVRRRD